MIYSGISMIYLWEKMTCRGTGFIFLPSSGLQRHLRESQFHSFSAILLICEQRPSNRQAKEIDAWKEGPLWPVLGLGILQHHSVTTTKFGFVATAKKFWAAPKPAQGKWHKLWQWHSLWKYQLEMAPVFPCVRAGGGSWRSHTGLSWAWSKDKRWDTVPGFCWCHCQCTQSSWCRGQGLWALPWLCPRTLLGFGEQGSPQCLSAEALEGLESFMSAATFLLPWF